MAAGNGYLVMTLTPETGMKVNREKSRRKINKAFRAGEITREARDGFFRGVEAAAMWFGVFVEPRENWIED